jgi:hypothetical protein
MKAALVAAALVLSAALVSSAIIFQRAVRDEIAGHKEYEQAEKQHQAAHQNWLKDREAVITFCHQIKPLTDECTRNGRTDNRRLLTMFEALDTTRCPQDFRVAWFDLMTFYEKQKRDATATLIEGVGTIAAWAFGYGEVAAVLGKGTLQSGEATAKDDATLPLRAVARCLVNYNITRGDLQ